MNLRAPVLAIVLLAASSCGGGDGGGTASNPVPGTLNLSLSSPNTDDGAVLFTVTGGPIDSVIPELYTTFSTRVDANTRRVVVAGNVVDGLLVRIRVPDVSKVGDYGASIGQVASRTSHTLRPVGIYSITISR
jgi:hypothetical protein